MDHSDLPVHEAIVPNGSGRLFVRAVGNGRPIIVVHGGPDFSHDYLLPALDRLADSVRLVYYDQRGRGRSFDVDGSDEVTIESEVDDLDAVRRSVVGAVPVAVLGHSWGGRLRTGSSPEGIVRARRIEDALYEQTWSGDYDLIPQLRELRIPTLVIHGDRDMVPVAIAEEIAAAIRGAHLVVLPDCGHFAYLDQPDEVHRRVVESVTTA